MKGTRRDVLLRLEEWLEDEQAERMVWLTGQRGSGKSTIAQTFAEICFADGTFGASFFCSQEFDDRSNLQLILPTLALQPAHRYPRFREELLKVLRANPDIGQESLDSQMEELIVGPFEVTQIRALIIIDDPDGCKDHEQYTSSILLVLAKHLDLIPNVKFLIASDLRGKASVVFSHCPIAKMLHLDMLKRSVVENDIKVFLRLGWRTSPGKTMLTSKMTGRAGT